MVRDFIKHWDEGRANVVVQLLHLCLKRRKRNWTTEITFKIFSDSREVSIVLIITWRHSILLPWFFLCVPGTVNSAKVQQKDEFKTSVNMLMAQREMCLQAKQTLCVFWIENSPVFIRSIIWDAFLIITVCIFIWERQRERERDRNPHTHRNREREKGRNRGKEREGDAISKIPSSDVWVLLFANEMPYHDHGNIFSLLFVILPHL